MVASLESLLKYSFVKEKKTCVRLEELMNKYKENGKTGRDDNRMKLSLNAILKSDN